MQENFQIPPPPITCSPQMDQPMEIGNSNLLFAILKMFLTIVSSQWFPQSWILMIYKSKSAGSMEAKMLTKDSKRIKGSP